MNHDAGWLKPVRWVGSARQDLQRCPKSIRNDIGHALYMAQRGQQHPNAKSLRGFGNASVIEIIANDPSGTFRAVYTVQFENAVYVIHVFQKKSRRGIAMPRSDTDSILRRLRRAREHYESL